MLKSVRRHMMLALALAGLLASATGCTYLRNRGKDAMDMFDLGFTFSKKPQFGIYANCPFMAPGGYAKVDGTYVGLGGGQVGMMDHHQDAAGLIMWGREDVGWSKAGESTEESEGSHVVGPLGLAADTEGNPTYKPQCAHYLHLGFFGVTGNLNYREWGDFFAGWLGADLCNDDNRTAKKKGKGPKPEDLPRQLSLPRSGLQLVVRADKETYRLDEPIVLDVKLVNRTGWQRNRRDKRRDLSVYFEPFAKTADGKRAEWLFKFHVFDQFREGARYQSPRFDVPPTQRANYYHHITLAPRAFVGRSFVLPPARAGNWLEPGDYFILVSYEVSNDYPYVILNREFTSRHAELLGTDTAYTRVWTGKLYSNPVVFSVRGNKRFVLF